MMFWVWFARLMPFLGDGCGGHYG